jgi:hypothetical protein
LPLASASSQTWNGGTGNWSNASNWTPAVVPNDPSTNVYIDNGNGVSSVVTYDLNLGFVNQLTLDPGDTLSVAPTTTLLTAQIYVSGTLNNAGYLQAIGGVVNTGIMNDTAGEIFALGLDNSGTINNGSGAFFFGGLDAPMWNNSGMINNYGSMIKEAGGDPFYNSGTVKNFGDFGFPNLDSINSGSIDNHGNYGGYVTNYGMFVNETGAHFTSSGSVNFGQFTNAGIIDAISDLRNYGTIRNSGTIYDGDFTQFEGSTIVDGLLSSSSSIYILGGTLSGRGVIQGDVVMVGTISPGDSPGALTIQGNYTQLAGGTFFAELAGLSAGTQYDQLVLNGTAILDGTLDVVLLNSFVVQLGDSFVLMTFAGETGQFSTLELPHLPVGETWQVFYNLNDITLNVVPTPEPGSFLLLGSAALGSIRVLRRKLQD